MIMEERRDYQIQASSFRILSQWTPAIGAVIVNVFLNVDSLFSFFVNWYRHLRTHTLCERKERAVKEDEALQP